ncbi:MAG: PaaI family thioesterase [bacterium]
MTTDRPVSSGRPGGTATNGHDHCLLCGYRNPWSLGLRYLSADDGSVNSSFKGHSGLQGYQGMLHGGVIAALLDSAMTHCLFHNGIQGLTADLHIRFVEPVPCDSLLAVQARIVSRRPPLFLLRAEMLQDCQLMAWAEAKFIAREPTKSGAPSSR